MGRVYTCAVVSLFAAGLWGGDQTTTQPPRVLPPSRAAAQPPASVPPPARPATAPTSKLKSASKPHLPDAQLEAVIRAKFAKSKLAADKLTVHVQGGVATVEGRTDVVQHKGNATRMCKTAGAVAVNNRVQVSDAAKQKAAGNLEEGRRRVQVKRGDARSDAPPDTQPAVQKKKQ